MGNVSSRLDTQAALFFRDQNRLFISSVSITSPRKHSNIQILPNSFPASRFLASRPTGDTTPIDFIQEGDVSSASPAQPPSFLLKLSSDEELVFNFKFIIRRSDDGTSSPIDTNIAGLTFVHGSNPRDVENTLTSEFHSNPNLHKMDNVTLIGDYATNGSPAVSFEWTWKWQPPKAMDERQAGWRNTCSFVEYDSRAHRLETLASFSFWVANDSQQSISQPTSPIPFFMSVPPKVRVVSAQTVDSRLSSSNDIDEPTSPMIPNLNPTPSSSVTTISPPQFIGTPSLATPVKIDIVCPKPDSELIATDDGPVFRATMKSLEQKTGNMRTQMKKVLKKAESAHASQTEANIAFESFIQSLHEASKTNMNAVKPAIDNFFDKISQEILKYETQNMENLKEIIIDPITRLYTSDIKQAEFKKRDFEDESKDYYAYVSRYLGQRQDSVKSKKLAESDSKYQSKRKNFELKRFDYSSFMQDLHGGRKDQEVLSQLTRFAKLQAESFINTSKRIESLMPHLEALRQEVQQADKEYHLQKIEREEKRRVLETRGPISDTGIASANANPLGSTNGQSALSDSELGRADSTSSQLRPILGSGSTVESSGLSSPANNSKFKGIRDLEDRNHIMLNTSSSPGGSSQRKEGLVWALSRPNGHVDPRAALKQSNWHKFWLVLDQGKLQEYSNWKEKLDLHMDPIDLRTASVREARNAERRFCFEVITPNLRRVYQATSEEDMNSWIVSINNALQSAMEGRGVRDIKPSPVVESSSFKRDIGKILTGKTGSLHGLHSNYQAISNSAGVPTRRITVGARPSTARTTTSSYDENPDRLLQMLRENDQGNAWCADCGSGTKVEWVSINLAIILCIECSGIHRSLGTHISKVRSLTLDITSFTPDIIELLMQVGNRVANMVWEARLDTALKCSPQATREQRLRFITAKYVNREYVTPISPTLSRYATADETLLAAVKKNDIQQVIYALALKANPNLADRSRGTPVVILAMAAANPASPASTGLTKSVATVAESEKTATFPVAEMLFQNGALVPMSAPAFPLSRSAQAYLDLKRGRANLLTSTSPEAGQTLTSSPSTHERMQRDKEARVQKRLSAGGRLAKSPIPEK
ncbi:putative ribosylation factor GTPase-activating protein cnt6 [Ceratocystis fimbriata CBS 114723]|uniref:ADP-ribosylation factor GTPase-activating protein n=1 Tax=Ceratocystis fimbriata CBS 114723 TaxID=1035309 RepID=A0A2C5X5F6_9PEZI|nr:putative ribosylation factor GTPase-activating protein cnt6 [Ceratocystis fimbriata CBS 114723]